MRPELEPLPDRMKHLPIDERGYPVPFFVAWVIKEADGSLTEVDDHRTPGAVPEFRAMAAKKWVRAIKENLCWCCGGVLGVHKTFVVGPMCGVNRTTTEPPCHRECAEWTARNCPFLSRPQMERRQHDDLVEKMDGKSLGGQAILRNPGVTLLWTTKTYKVWSPKPGERLIQLGDPTHVAWFAEGRQATRAEVEHSVTTGLPALMELAEAQQREEGVPAVGELLRIVDAFSQMYPAEA